MPRASGLLRSSWFVLLVFLAIGFTVYWPSLRGDRIWDDHYLIGENPLFRSPVFAGEVFRHYLFFESRSTYYRPVQNLTYILDYCLWGEATSGYHITNIVIHVLAAWMLWIVLLRLLPGLGVDAKRSGWTALCVALVWLVHPVHTAAVAYISGRADPLSAVFSLTAWLLFIAGGNATMRPGNWFRALALYGLAGACLLLALCSKEIALVWLLIFASHQVFFCRSRPWRDRVMPVVCAAAILIAYAGLRTLPGARGPQPAVIAEDIVGRALVAARALGDYASLIVFPGRLMMERSLGDSGMYASRDAWVSAIGYEWLSIAGLAVLAFGIWCCVKRDGLRSLRRFGVVWFVIAFTPISNLFPLNAQVAEHWIYTASIGALLVFAGVMLSASAMHPRAWVVLSLVLTCAFGLRTWYRAGDWVDGETFARKTIANGGGTARMFAYLAQELGAQGRHAEQEKVLRQAVAMFPGYLAARVNLGICLKKQGKNEEAKLLLAPPASQTAPQAPRDWNAAINTARALHELGQHEAALALLREWRARNPDTWELIAVEAAILAKTRGPEAALPVIRDYASAHWWHLPAWLGLAGFQREAGHFDEARASALAASRLDIRGAEAFAELARIEVESGRLEAALDAAGTVVARAPGKSESWFLLAAVLERSGRHSEAAAAMRKGNALHQ